MSRLAARVACIALVVVLLPAVQAGPLPDDLFPPEPQETQALTGPVKKLLKELYPDSAPFATECVKTDSGTYRPEEEPPRPVTIDEAHGFVVVTIWLEGTYQEVKIDSRCIDE